MNAKPKTARDKHLARLISKQPFCEGMDKSQLEWLASSAMEIDFASGQFIFKQGDPANRFYLILNGEVTLTFQSEKKEHFLARKLVGGENLGWSWLFEPYFFHATAQATEPTKALFFYGTHLRQKCEDDKNHGYEIMKRVANEAVLAFTLAQKDMVRLSRATGRKVFRA